MAKTPTVDIVVRVSSLKEAAELFLLFWRQEPRGIRQTSGYKQLKKYVKDQTNPDENLGVLEGELTIAHILKRNGIMTLAVLVNTSEETLLSLDGLGIQKLKSIRVLQGVQAKL